MTDYEEHIKDWAARSLKVSIDEITYVSDDESYSYTNCDTCGPESVMILDVELTNGREARLEEKFGNLGTIVRGEPIYEGWELKTKGWV